jgi:hypothetical protein
VIEFVTTGQPQHAELLEYARRDLSQALRQWKMYAEEKEDYDIANDGDLESIYYQGCAKTLKDLEKEIDKLCGINRD